MQRAVRVLAPRLDGDLDAGQLLDGLRDDARDLLGHVLRDAHGVEPRAGGLSSVVRMSDGSMPSSVPSRCATSSRRLNGRSAGMILTAHVATLVTSSRPLRS